MVKKKLIISLQYRSSRFIALLSIQLTGKVFSKKNSERLRVDMQVAKPASIYVDKTWLDTCTITILYGPDIHYIFLGFRNQRLRERDHITKISPSLCPFVYHQAVSKRLSIAQPKPLERAKVLFRSYIKTETRIQRNSHNHINILDISDFGVFILNH